MPLPTNPDLKWPPSDGFATYDRYKEYDAWYSGDPQRLSAVYASMASRDSTPMTNGLVNIVRSWFWGKQAIAPSTRARIHVPIAADISTTSADLLFSSGPDLKVDSSVQDRLDKVVEDEFIVRRSLEGAEIASALGGVFPRVTWDMEVVPDRPILTFVHPDSAIADFKWGRLVGVTFWREVERDDAVVYRHLERHELDNGEGVVLHGLYKGTDSKLGSVVPLTDLAATADLADVVTDGNVIRTGIPRLTAAYIPNMLPNRDARGSQYGRSDYSGAEWLMDALDETLSSWMRDLRLGRGRLVVPAEYMRALPNQSGGGKGGGAWFDTDQEVFVPLQGMNPNEGSGITINQFEIRTQQHADTAMALIERIVSVAGYSASSFGLEGDQGAQTATEIESRERRSFITRDKKAQYWAPALAEVLETYLMLDAKLFDGPASNDVDVRVTFPDVVRENVSQRATAIELIARAQAASKQTLVQMQHPEWSPNEVAQEVARIKDEATAQVPDISSFVHGGATQPSPQEPQQPQPAAK